MRLGLECTRLVVCGWLGLSALCACSDSDMQSSDRTGGGTAGGAPYRDTSNSESANGTATGAPNAESQLAPNLPTAAEAPQETELVPPGFDLPVAEGRIALEQNGAEIEGPFFTYGDSSGRTQIGPSAALQSSNGYCVAGSAGQVINMDFGGTYGAVAALNLRQPAGSDVVGGYDAEGHGVAGVGFEIRGETGGRLRFVAKMLGVHDGFCVDSVPECASGCSIAFRFQDLTQNCWNPGGVVLTPNNVAALEWQITTTDEGPTPFDFCVENLRALLAEGAAPAAP
jgi:hypothetical protein